MMRFLNRWQCVFRSWQAAICLQPAQPARPPAWLAHHPHLHARWPYSQRQQMHWCILYMGEKSQRAYKTSRVGKSFIGTPDDMRGERGRWAGRKGRRMCKVAIDGTTSQNSLTYLCLLGASIFYCCWLNEVNRRFHFSIFFIASDHVEFKDK